MTPDQAHLGFAAFDGMSLSEDVQLVLAVGKGQLRQGVMETAAAALVELALRGRVGSVPDAGFLLAPSHANSSSSMPRRQGFRRSIAHCGSWSRRGSPGPRTNVCEKSGGRFLGSCKRS